MILLIKEHIDFHEKDMLTQFAYEFTFPFQTFNLFVPKPLIMILLTEWMKRDMLLIFTYECNFSFCTLNPLLFYE